MDREGWKFLIEIVAIITVLVGLYMTNAQLNQNAELSRYTYLTGLWNDIMKESVNHPEFQNKTKNLKYKVVYKNDMRNKYETYTRWIGGFIEDLYYHNYEEGKGLVFFKPTVNTFLDLHCRWFVDHIEYYKFTDKLYTRLKQMKCVCPSSSEQDHSLRSIQ